MIPEQRIEEWTRKNSFSGVISVTQGENSIYQRAFGYADRANKRLNTTETRFAIASGTKFLTALAIGRLIDQKRITLKTHAKQLITELPQLSEAATIHQLLNHTSGVFDYLDEELIEDFDAFELPIPPYKLNSCTDYLPMLRGRAKFRPGQRFSYSNGGYILLGVIIEAITKITFQEFVTAELLGPLSMNRTGFYAFNALPGNCALNYLYNDSSNEKYETNIYKLPIIGASDGGVFTTARDIASLWAAYTSNQILSPELTSEFMSARISVSDSLSYGYGYWLRERTDKTPTPYLLGMDAGVRFQSTFHNCGTTVTILGNSNVETQTLSALIDEHLSL